MYPIIHSTNIEYFLPGIGLSIVIMTMKPVDSFLSARNLNLVEDAEREIGRYSVVC